MDSIAEPAAIRYSPNPVAHDIEPGKILHSRPPVRSPGAGRRSSLGRPSEGNRLTLNSRSPIPIPANEPVRTYAPGSTEREDLKRELAAMNARELDIPLIIGGQEVRTEHTVDVVAPHDHGHVLGRCHRAGPEHVQQAIESGREAWHAWAATPWEERAAVFLKAADLASTSWRATLNASTMLGQSKTIHQAEIDAVCELVDFFRFNAFFAERIQGEQPFSARGMLNRADYRPLEGFVYAITPFNFTAIGGNLPGAPALMGNVVQWKPSSSAVLSNYYVMRLFMEAGLPPGVINFLPGDPTVVTEGLMAQTDFCGIHFTGSTTVFQELWKRAGTGIARYRSYPRIVGETGGKNFVLAHASADPEALVTALVRGAFEYQGQKCSAASRAYVPKRLWAEIGGELARQVDSLLVGDVRDFRNFMGAVIDERAFRKIAGYIDRAAETDAAEVLAGGEYDDTSGWFVRPTLIRSHDARYEAMCDEIFGPVLTVYVYDEARWAETLELVDTTSPYGLTGAVFARERQAIREAAERLRFTAGNFYVNDKPTGAVVGQQPFGGSRASGTNDKAGSALNLFRWVSARSIKETLLPTTNYRYPFMEAE